MLIMKKIFVAGIVFLIFILIGIYYSDSEVRRASIGKTYDIVEEIPAKDVAVVFGTSKYLVEGGLNRYYVERIQAAYELYRNGKVKYLLLSGDNALMEYNEPKRMKKSLLDLGVPKEKIFLDYAGFRTLDTVVRAKEVFGLESFIVVSQKFQNERAIYIGRKEGLEVIGFNAEGPKKGKLWFRERLARVKAVLDVNILETKPKYLGEKIEIEE